MKQIYQIATAFIALVCLFLTPSIAQAEENQTILERFNGTWTAKGNSFGDFRSSMIWSKTLDGQFHRIDYQIATMNSFNGVGHYKTTKENHTSGYWADSGGDLHPLSVQFEDSAIVTNWGIAGKKQGRTEYRLVNDNRAIVTDWLLTSDGWQQFNQAEFLRKTATE